MKGATARLESATNRACHTTHRVVNSDREMGVVLLQGKRFRMGKDNRHFLT